MQITPQQIKAACAVASDVFDKKLTIKAGATLLYSRHGLNIGSASDYINDYRCMLRGKVFHRTMSAPATDYFLTRIEAERGTQSLQPALKAVWKHIQYYEGHESVTLHKMRKVVTRHQDNLTTPRDMGMQERSFAADVRRAINDSPEKRKRRLQHAAKVPLKIQAVCEVYLRNPDVVAEVMIRANGVCERCAKPAPFLKKKDGEPYLEVHHIRLLADGGEDTVENAIAVCPNCHRRVHYGKETEE